MKDQIDHYRAKLQYEIDSWDLKIARESGGHVTVIDVRTPAAFAREHIPGAINVPHRTMNRETTAAIDKERTLVGMELVPGP